MVEKLERIVLNQEVKAYLSLLTDRGVNFDLETDLETAPLTDLRWLVRQLKDLARTPTSG